MFLSINFFRVLFSCWLFHIGAPSYYSEQDIKLIEDLGVFYATRYFVFIQENDSTNITETLKSFSDRKLFSSVISTNDLRKVLTIPFKQTRFFKRKILIATSDYVNFTQILPQILFPRSVTWIIFSRSIQEFEEFYIPLNINLLVVDSQPSNVSVHRIYKIHSASEMVVESFGIWSGGRLIGTTLKDSSGRYNFRNTSLRILMHKYNGDKENCILTHNLLLFKMRCFHTELVEILSKTLNFHLKVIKYLDMDHSYYSTNNSLSEVFIWLQNREVDLSGCTYTVDSQRQKLYDFAWPTFSPKSRLYIKNEPGESFWHAYIKPFHLNIHYIILTWIVGSGIIVQIFRSIRSDKFRLQIASTIKSILKSLQIFCNQGFPRITKWCSERIIYILTFLFVVLVYQGYSAKLISSLTIVAPNIPFLTFDDFISKGSYRLMTLIEGFHKIVFIKYLHNAGMEHMIIDDSELPTSAKNAVSKLCADGHLTYIEFRENLVQHELECEITEIPKPVFSYHIGLGLQKNSPYQESVSQEITRFQANGIMNRMRTHLLSYKNLKNPDNSGFVSVTLEQVILPFAILVFGIALSLIVLMIETQFRNRTVQEYQERRIRIRHTKMLQDVTSKKEISGMRMDAEKFPFPQTMANRGYDKKSGAPQNKIIVVGPMVHQRQESQVNSFSTTTITNNNVK